MSSTNFVVVEDIIAGILCRLPANDLLRYRAVSKPWRSLIDSPDFIKLHLSHSKRNLGAIIRDRDLYWININSPSLASKLPNPIDDSAGTTEVFGTSNGLVVLKNSSGHVALWNPSTRRHNMIPIPRAESEFPGLSTLLSNDLIGFGHDPVNDDYKVVRMVLFSCKHRGFNSVFMVHSLNKAKAKRWKRVSTQGLLTYADCFKRGTALVESAIHWFVIRLPLPGLEGEPPTATASETPPTMSIFAFDVGAERFRQVPQPNYDPKFEKKLVELRGCLSVVCRYTEPCKYVVWMMKEYGIPGSWTKLVSLGQREMGGPFIYTVPIAFVNGGDKILLEKDGDVLVMYDLLRKRANIVKLSGINGYTEINACVQSLVRLDWDGGDTDLEKEKSKQSGNKRDDFLSKGFSLKL